jgi:hypothetical protein
MHDFSDFDDSLTLVTGTVEVGVQCESESPTQVSRGGQKLFAYTSQGYGDGRNKSASVGTFLAIDIP